MVQGAYLTFPNVTINQGNSLGGWNQSFNCYKARSDGIYYFSITATLASTKTYWLALEVNGDSYCELGIDADTAVAIDTVSRG